VLYEKKSGLDLETKKKVPALGGDRLRKHNTNKWLHQSEYLQGFTWMVKEILPKTGKAKSTCLMALSSPLYVVTPKESTIVT